MKQTQARHCLECRVAIACLAGCCGPCYRFLAKNVKKGNITWEQLEQMGKVLPHDPGKYAYMVNSEVNGRQGGPGGRH